MADDTNLWRIFAIAGVLIYLWWFHTQVKRVAPLLTADPVFEAVRSGAPIVLYFSSPDQETDCNSTQQAMLSRLRTVLPDTVQIVEIDATCDLQAADRWEVITTPTIFVLDDSLQVRYMNIGVTDAPKLMAQLLSVLRGESWTEEEPAGQLFEFPF